MADPSLPVLAADYGELAQRIGRAALTAERIGAYGTAGVLIEAIPSLFTSLGERAGQEVDALRMELAQALAHDAEPLRALVSWMVERERQAAAEASAQDHDPAGSAERQAICDREARSFREVIDRLLTACPGLEPDRREVRRGGE